MELPSSWVDPLNIEGDAFRLRYPGGEKSSSFLKATVENFAVNSREDGMVQRVVLYKDLARTTEMRRREIFSMRKDRLEHF